MITVCPKCNKQVRPNTRYCGFCGNDLSIAMDAPVPKSPSTKSHQPMSQLTTMIVMISIFLLICGIAVILIWLKGIKVNSPSPLPSFVEEATTSVEENPPTMQVLPTQTFVLLPTEMVIPSSTQTVVPSPTLTVIIQPTFQPPIPDPVEFINTYYNYINNRDYGAAWSCLSKRFIDEKGYSLGRPYDYITDYAAYWDTVSRMDILEAKTEYMDSQSTAIFLRLRWNMVRGDAPEYNHRFHLVINPSSGSWLIDTVETWR